MTKQRPYSLLIIIVLVLFSGLCWYLSIGLNGNFWYLAWIAPLPVLCIAFNNKGKTAFIAAFTAYLIGRLSWFTYLQSVVTLVPAIIITLLLPLLFALIVLLTRFIVIKINTWLSIFAFPVLFTGYEFLLMTFSKDGTATSIAYSQSEFLPLIQIASVTGILGITFIICFIPSAIAVAWHYRKIKSILLNTGIAFFIILLPVFLYGFIRLIHKEENNFITAGLVVLEERYHTISEHPDFGKEKTIAELYAAEISKLAQNGLKAIVLPERAININKENENEITGILSNAAKQNHVYIIGGYTNFRNAKFYNSSLVIDDGGNVIAGYNKTHLVTGLEAWFSPGKAIGLFRFNNIPTGTAICKDMDFPSYISKYGNGGAGILFIPAWDFIQDDWLHSRMAVLRGVENGFSEVRTARQGRLTISDYCGRVNYEANCANGNAASLSGKVSIQKIDTFYRRYGNWTGIICLAAALLFIFYSARNKNTP